MNLRRYTHIGITLATGAVLLAALLLTVSGTALLARANGSNVFVTPGGSGNCSQASPCDLESALGAAAAGDSIYLAEGTYTGSGEAVVTITKSVTIYGGWNGTTTTPAIRDPEVHPAVIDGEGARRGIRIIGPATVSLEGLTVARGQIVSTTSAIWDGAGLHAQDADLTLRHTRFYTNRTDIYDVDGSFAYGGGVAVDGGNLVVEASVFRWNSTRSRWSNYGAGLSARGAGSVSVTGSTFQDNDAWHASGVYVKGDADRTLLNLSGNTFVDNGRAQSGGRGSGGYAAAMEVADARARIEDNVIRGSRASNDYGAVRISSADLSLARNVIIGTECGQISGLYLYYVSPFTLTNNLIVGNETTRSWLERPAVRVQRSSGELIHNTIARNESAYGLQVDGSSVVTMTNTLLVSHTVGISVTADSAARLEGTLWGNGAWANGTDWGGDGDILTGTINIWGDPAFVDPAGGDYHIEFASAARDAGVDAGVTVDVDGDVRPWGEGYDIGGDEFVPRWHVFLPLVTVSD